MFRKSQIIDPSGNPNLEFQGNENGPANGVDFDKTNFNDATNNIINKYLNGSFGNYSTNLDDSCICLPLIITENSIPIPSGIIEAIQAIYSAGQIPATGNVIMKAEMMVKLNGGFEVKDGGELDVIIAPACN